jgi:hypothetical protein
MKITILGQKKLVQNKTNFFVLTSRISSRGSTMFEKMINEKQTTKRKCILLENSEEVVATS